MADLGNLWFSLGLDNSKFDKEWKAAFEKYKQDAKIDVLINIDKNQLKSITDVTDALSKVKGVTGKTRAKIDIEVTPRTIEAIKALRDMGITKAQLQAIKNAARATEEYAKHLERAKSISDTGHKTIVKNYNEQALWLQNLRTLAANYLSVYGIKTFVTELASMTGEFEKQRITLQAMVGELEGLDIYEKMKALSVESPFQFKDLASYAKQLAAFSVPYNELYDTTKRLADISAGLGVDMSRIILAFGQIKNAGVLRGTELRQLTEAGVPILDKLAKKFEELEGQTVSIGDVFERISKRMVSFEMVKEIFEDLTNKGGKFYNMQQIQAETLAGKISNLKDAYDIMLTEIGEASEDELKKGVEVLYKLINSWETVAIVLKTVIATYGAYQAIHILAFSASKISMVARMASTMLTYATNLKKAVSLMSTFGIVSKAGVYGAIAAAIAGVSMAIYQSYKMANKFRNELVKIGETKFAELQNETDKLNLLVQAIKNTAEGTEERKKLIDRMNNEYGSYIDNILKETDALYKVEQAQKDITMALRDRAKEQAFVDASKSITESFTETSTNAVKGMLSALEGKGFSKVMAVEISSKVREALQNNPDLTIGDEVLKNIIRSIEGVDVDKAVDALREKISIDSGVGPRREVATWSSIKQLAGAFRILNNETKEAKDFFTVLYGKSPKDLEKEYNKLTQSYQHAIAQIDLSGLPDADKKKFDAQVTYLNELIKLYALMPSEQQKYIDKLEEITSKTDEWILSAQKVFKDKGVLENFAPKKGDNFLGYVEKMQQDYKEIIDSLKKLQKTDPNGIKPALEARRDVYELLAAQWGIKLDEKAENKANQAKLKAEREAVAKLKVQYDSLLAVYKAYVDLRKKTGSEGIATRAVAEEFGDYKNGLLAALEKDGSPKQYFEQIFAGLGELALANGGEFGERFVEGMKSTLGTLDIKEVVDAIGISKSLVDELKKWGMEDFTLQGKGATLDISKALKEQDEADRRAIAKAQEVQEKINQIYNAGEAEKAAAREVLINEIARQEELSEEQIAELKKKSLDDIFSYAIDRANELAQTEGENNKKIAQDKINELGKAYAKQMVEESKALGPGAFENLANKSYGNLKALQQELNTLMSQDPKISDETKKKLEEQGITLDEFIKNYKDYLALLGKNVKDSKGEKLKEDLLAAGDAALDVVESLKQLSDTDFMSGFLDAMGLGLGVAKEITQAFSKKEDGSGFELTNVTSLIGAISMVATSVINGVAAAKQYAAEMRKAGEAFKTGVIESVNEALVLGEKFETIFGDNVIAALNADNQAIQNTVRELRNASKSVANMKIKTKKGFWGIGAQYTTLSDLAPQLFKPDGTVNGKYLDEFLDAYGDKLSDSQKSLLEHLKTTYEQYEDAMADVNDYLSGIFSDTASTIADRMIDAFAVTGNAATELGDMVNGIARHMAKDLIQSLLIEQYLNPAMDRVKSLYDAESKSYEADPTVRIQKSILAMREGLEQAETGAAEVTKILQGLADYGIDFSQNAENSSDVLSGLTEAQQNLLMGYINGIRADVSYNKGMMSNIVNSVGTINNNVADAIIVWKQIEANTHRSADGVDRIIGFFESVMGPYDGGGGQAFKVNIA